ncbi:AAA family ATPase [Pseudobacteriovorax antillogorgiicola]|uniref:Uridine kinase n=1 Tax=Pseudobacteriovorax antillogorgiicola TaxID=1513793 RepID=A0A1Y6BKL8_9BACT|nr:AAA family ATPase [Pseudobacteriovorax antillogorgiicola]TCS56403.1 uridine kinase [Pseudobacteriovorax antillogorgiicola]SMF06019.1 Uridine kinase [Pseudobacteriovorax antillogorgiicola]
MPTFDSVLCRIVGQLESIEKARPKLISIDGCPGSGKTALAQALARACGAQVVKASHFLGTIAEDSSPEEQFAKLYHWDEIEEKILRPTTSGRPIAYTPRDSNTENSEKLLQLCLPSKDIILEGSFISKQEFSQYFDFKIYMNTPAEERLKNLKREGKDQLDRYQSLLSLENWYLETINPAKVCDFCCAHL